MVEDFEAQGMQVRPCHAGTVIRGEVAVRTESKRLVERVYRGARDLLRELLLSTLPSCLEVLVQQLGIIGAAISTALAMLIGSGIIMNWFYWKRTGIDIPAFWKQICRVAAAPFALFAIVFLLYATVLPAASGWLALVGYLVAYVILYVAICWAFSFNAYEKGLLRTLVRRGR